MKPNLLLLSLRFKGNNGYDILLMWVSKVVFQIAKEEKEIFIEEAQSLDMV